MNKICVEIKCPFFISETEKTLSCEGVAAGIVNVMRYKTSIAKMEQIRKYCANYPNACHIGKAAGHKYKE